MCDFHKKNIDKIQAAEMTVNEGLEYITSNLNTIFKPYCCKTFNVSNRKTQAKPFYNKPWFDNKCKSLYTAYRNSLFVFSKDRCMSNRVRLVETKRKYKRYERRQKRNYLRFEGIRISYLMKNNPSEFYGLFKRRPRTPPTDLTLNDFYNHFKELVTNKNANDYIEISNVEECFYQELDYPVQAIIANLKSKTSAGKDNLINEYFITFKDVFVPLLVRLFNDIFDSGNFPSIWTEGIIIPLFKKGHANDANNYRGITLISCLQ